MCSTAIRANSLFLLFFLRDGSRLDLLDLGLDLLAVGVGERVGLEARLWRGLTPGLRHVLEVVEPLHAQDLFQVGATMPILFEQHRADVFRLLTYALPRMEREVGSVLDRLPCDLLVVLIVKGKHATQQQVGDHTE